MMSTPVARFDACGCMRFVYAENRCFLDGPTDMSVPTLAGSGQQFRPPLLDAVCESVCGKRIISSKVYREELGFFPGAHTENLTYRRDDCHTLPHSSCAGEAPE